MSKRAIDAAMKALPNYPPEIYADSDEYIEVESERSMQRAFYQKGYEQAEKDTIERVVSWLIKNVDYYIGGMEVSRCLPIKYHVSCACWADLKAFMEEEQ